MSPPTSPEPVYTHLSVRLLKEDADQFKAVCDAEYRPVATQIRRMIHEYIENHTEEEAA